LYLQHLLFLVTVLFLISLFFEGPQPKEHLNKSLKLHFTMFYFFAGNGITFSVNSKSTLLTACSQHPDLLLKMTQWMRLFLNTG